MALLGRAAAEGLIAGGVLPVIKHIPGHGRAIADSHGRIMVVMTHNTDIGDAMEREAEDPAFFAAFSPHGYQVTINMVLYALSH